MGWTSNFLTHSPNNVPNNGYVNTDSQWDNTIILWLTRSNKRYTATLYGTAAIAHSKVRDKYRPVALSFLALHCCVFVVFCVYTCKCDLPINQLDLISSVLHCRLSPEILRSGFTMQSTTDVWEETSAKWQTANYSIENMTTPAFQQGSPMPSNFFTHFKIAVLVMTTLAALGNILVLVGFGLAGRSKMNTSSIYIANHTTLEQSLFFQYSPQLSNPLPH